jgi:hypothetical protein
MKSMTRLALFAMMCTCQHQLVAQTWVDCYGGGTITHVTEISGYCDGHAASGTSGDEEAFCDSGHLRETHVEYLSWEECGTIGTCVTATTTCI